MTQPESFTLDHRIVDAPYVRVAEVCPLRSGQAVTKFDVRFCQPNVDHLDMASIHSIEHMLAGFLRVYSDDVIDISPMGCQTGFYVSIDGELSVENFSGVLASACEDLLEATEVPAANEVQCGWADSHSLAGAKAAGRKFLGAREVWGEVFAQ